MINAHTLTRIYREARFNIQVFLESLVSIMDTSSTDLVEALWSDGSMDVIPSIALAHSIVGNTFPMVSIDDCNLKPGDSSNTYLYIYGGNGLKARFEELGDDSSNTIYRDSTIYGIEADNISFTDVNIPVVIKDSSDIGTITTDILKVDTLECNTLNYTSAQVSSNLDLSGLVLSSTIISADSKTYGSSQLLSYLDSKTSGLNNSIQLTGPVCLAESGVFGESLRNTYSSRFTKAPRAYVAVPLVNNVGYAYTPAISLVSNGINTSIPENSELGLLCIYPKVSGSYVYHSEANPPYDAFTFVMDKLDDSDNYKIIQVRNVSGSSIRACNVWQVSTSTLGTPPVIMGLNYVEIPPYSNIDFLLSYLEDKATSTRVIKMLPMKHLSMGV